VARDFILLGGTAQGGGFLGYLLFLFKFYYYYFVYELEGQPRVGQLLNGNCCLLTCRPLPLSCSSMVFQAHNLCGPSSSLRVGVRFNATSIILVVVLCFHNMAWPIVKSIVKLFRLDFHIALPIPLSPLCPLLPCGSFDLDFGTESPSCLPFESSLTSFVCVHPFCFVSKGACSFLSSYGPICLKLV